MTYHFIDRKDVTIYTSFLIYLFLITFNSFCYVLGNGSVDRVLPIMLTQLAEQEANRCDGMQCSSKLRLLGDFDNLPKNED